MMPVVDEKELKYDGIKGIPTSSFGGEEVPKTGDWRTFKPHINKAKCIKCRTCVVFCPEGAISVGKDGFPYINYHICKGCLVCVRVCPVKAISVVGDLHSENIRSLRGGER